MSEPEPSTKQDGFENSIKHKLASALVDEKEVIGVAGSDNINQRVYSAASVDTGSCTFSIKPDSGSLISRRIVMEMPVTVTHTVGAANLLFHPAFSPRQYALLQAISRIELVVNNTSVTSLPAEFISAWSRYHLNDAIMQEQAEFLPSPDFADPNAVTPLYGIAVGAPGNYSKNKRTVSYKDKAKLPFGIADEGCFYPNRATEHQFVETGTGGTTITRVYTFRCPLFVNDFLDFIPGRTLANVTSLDINITFVNDMSQIFTSPSNENSGFLGDVNDALFNDNNDSAVPLTPAMCSVGSALNAPTIAGFKVFIDLYKSPVLIPRSLTYEMSAYQNHSYSVGALNYGSTHTVQTGDIQLSQVPQSVYVFCQQNTAQRTTNAGSCFMTINSLKVNAGSKLTSYTRREVLRELMLENGMYCPSLHEYNGCLRLEFGKDLPMPDGGGVPVFVGSPISSSLNMEVVVENLSGVVRTYMRLYIVVQYPRRIELGRDESMTIQGLKSSEVSQLASTPVNLQSASDMDNAEMHGGSFFKKMFKKKNFSKKKILGAIHAMNKIVSAIDPKGENFGAVKRGLDVGDAVVHAGVHGGQLIGGSSKASGGGEAPPGRYMQFS